MQRYLAIRYTPRFTEIVSIDMPAYIVLYLLNRVCICELSTTVLFSIYMLLSDHAACVEISNTVFFARDRVQGSSLFGANNHGWL